MKALRPWLLFETVAFLTANPALAQTPPSLSLQLFGGVNVTGAVGSVYVVQSTSNPISDKIIRGGAWDGFEADCRSAKRMGFGVSPFPKDFILCFRVALSAP